MYMDLKAPNGVLGVYGAAYVLFPATGCARTGVQHFDLGCLRFCFWYYGVIKMIILCVSDKKTMDVKIMIV